MLGGYNNEHAYLLTPAVLGVDLSRSAGTDIDWDQGRSNGYSVAVAEARGNVTDNPHAAPDLSGAKSSGFVIGTYCLLAFTGSLDGTAQIHDGLTAIWQQTGWICGCSRSLQLT